MTLNELTICAVAGIVVVAVVEVIRWHINRAERARLDLMRSNTEKKR